MSLEFLYYYISDLRGGALPPTDERNFIAYWLLLATPWPRSAAGRAGFTAAAALGALFDATNVRPARLRKMAEAWLTWSEDMLNNNLGPTWKAACATGMYPALDPVAAADAPAVQTSAASRQSAAAAGGDLTPRQHGVRASATRAAQHNRGRKAPPLTVIYLCK